MYYLTDEFGNDGSRTHEYGSRAKRAVQKARDQVGKLVDAQRDEVIFTSGATESNNLAILGLIEHGKETGQMHVITTEIEHKAVLEPVDAMEAQGFDVTRISVDRSGRVDPKAIQEALRPDTLLVSVMHINNETGVSQPLAEIADVLSDHEVWFHTDAAQGYGKDLETLKNPRIDLMSISGHKLYAPKGVGALIMRRRGYERPPIRSLFYGGGQERGLRPGTVPVALVAALGQAAEVSARDHSSRIKKCKEIRQQVMNAFDKLSPEYHGDSNHVMDHVINLSFGDLDSEALMVVLKDLIAVSNGSACTSASYTPSHVLKAMGMSDDEANCAIRISWCHLTPEVDWQAVTDRIKSLL